MDAVLTPNAITGRMTMGHMTEALFSTLCAYHGQIGDGTAFQDFTVEDIMDLLKEAGLSSTGFYPMYDGRTGERIETEIFAGFIYYQRLKQLVAEKLHQRARGPLHPVTRQPTDGRARDGGLRFGEMEKDTVVCHGASAIVKERLFEQSDYYELPVCTTCGVIASIPKDDDLIVKRRVPCRLCHTDANIHLLPLPFPVKMLIQECQSMNCLLRLVFDNPENPSAITGVMMDDDSI